MDINWKELKDRAQKIAEGANIKTSVSLWYDEGIEFDSGWLTISARIEEVKRETILETIVTNEPHYVVEAAEVRHSMSSWEMDDVDEFEIGSFRYFEDAVKRVLLYIKEVEINNTIDSLIEWRWE